ncbi:MAG: DUF2007 domain-containing protein [Candidatus Omnitrophica bacterium]|nr:DUF2007 domain-containing protein [Candidatus Omnitrophota bacterium]
MDKNDENLVVVYITEDQVEESLIQSALQDAGIDCAIHNHEILDYLQSTELNSGSQIQVLEEDVDRAKTIIAEVLQSSQSNPIEDSAQEDE